MSMEPIRTWGCGSLVVCVEGGLARERDFEVPRSILSRNRTITASHSGRKDKFMSLRTIQRPRHIKIDGFRAEQQEKNSESSLLQ